MDVEVSPTRKVSILGLDKRPVNDIVWCATTFGANRLYWIDGYVLCLEVYEKSFEHELKKKEFPISQICYAKFPKYEKIYEVEKSLQLPIVNVSDMKIFKSILEVILKDENEQK
ncbi:MAG: hypothetical protein QHH18_05600 [Candidatus Bathyarchaeota archaeon]|jgi:hypothetical protein|nr:hypothetical protein [Candidatus Bathyarchaeota archaeon A05DMB-5]MDH7558064.1 hypothetical protein [Candidatus Bathyarchaeota archaeon]